MIPQELVERLHHVLVEEIRTRRPEYLRGPFTVAEIYQDLVPYRTHRDRLGASMNGDYEHALLRLLAGEGDYLRVESEPARKRMAEELGSSNPNTGIYREFAALDVRLNPERLAVASEAALSEAAAPPPVGAAGLEPPAALGGEQVPAPGGRGAAEEAGAVAETAPGRGESTEAASSPQGEGCRWCGQALPPRPGLRYCPFCGTDVNLVPCPSCGEELERAWRYCIACGAEVAEE